MILEDFFWRAMLAGIGVALVAGPLGCFVVWRKMAYFGDTMAHSALLGVALGLLFGVAPMIGVFAVGLVVALLLSGFLQKPFLSGDTLLGTLSHASLALGVLLISLMTWLRVDLLGYLFGDILSVTRTDLLWIYAVGGITLILLAWLWRPLLAITVDRELAGAEGMNVISCELTLMLVIAAVIALAMKVVGILLITSLLIIPAAAARHLCRTPEQMAAAAAIIGVLSVALGLFASFHFDTPSGPSIVTAAVFLFMLGQLPLAVRS
ncbi:MAG TPA: hypothetical protein DIT94_05055 [Deltaproteobacteria bacterium]|nr:metal ABC transporter permease [SAR324 cluster bacterium]HCP33733.1 hypothetical protein [Deltaproteobacteria bacterium]